jgi:hypothetical protein
MPKVFDWNGFRFHFFASEGGTRERPRVLSDLLHVIEAQRDDIESAWHDFFA